jgi:hypothetical protein
LFKLSGMEIPARAKLVSKPFQERKDGRDDWI